MKFIRDDDYEMAQELLINVRRHLRAKGEQSLADEVHRAISLMAEWRSTINDAKEDSA